MTTITIPGNTVSLKNSKRIIRAGGYPKLVPSRPYEAWAQYARLLLRDHALIGHEWTYPVSVHFHFYRLTRHRFDFINLAQGPLDVLVEVGILADDDMRHVIPAGFDWSVDRNNPRAVLTIV